MRFILLLSLPLYALDQVTKWFVLHHINPDDRALLAKLCGGLPLVISVLAEHIARRPSAHLTAFAQQLSRRQLLTDPQTSGGLLVACAPDRAEAIVEIIRGRSYAAARRIGHVEAGEPIVRIE